jgi:hypothetical protein
VIFVAIDWSEHYHDVCVIDERGTQLAQSSGPRGHGGVVRLHETIADHTEEPEEVIVGIEIDRGLLVGALVGAGYRVFAIDPLSVDRYRDRHATSGGQVRSWGRQGSRGFWSEPIGTTTAPGGR